MIACKGSGDGKKSGKDSTVAVPLYEHTDTAAVPVVLYYDQQGIVHFTKGFVILKGFKVQDGKDSTGNPIWKWAQLPKQNCFLDSRKRPVPTAF